MAGSAHSTRVDRLAVLSAAFARMADDELRDWIGPPGQGSGWGDSQAKDFGGTAVFVKRLRVTDQELRAPFSTRNTYQLPLCYSYGVASAGFGAFREVAGHELANRWVLDGLCPGFPLMYHVRVLEREPVASRLDNATQKGYVEFWNNSKAVERYMADRREASHEAVVILEHHPFTLAPWLAENPGSIDEVLQQLFSVIAAVRDSGSVHFDAHFSNVVTDGSAVFLTDFGLLMSREFELEANERAFLDRHMEYDYGEVLYSLGTQIARQVGRLPEEERLRVQNALALQGRLLAGANLCRLIERVDEVAELMSLPATLLAASSRYRQPMLYMASFLETLRANPRKDTVFEGPKLRRLLLESGVPVGT